MNELYSPDKGLEFWATSALNEALLQAKGRVVVLQLGWNMASAILKIKFNTDLPTIARRGVYGSDVYLGRYKNAVKIYYSSSLPPDKFTINSSDELIAAPPKQKKKEPIRKLRLNND